MAPGLIIDTTRWTRVLSGSHINSAIKIQGVNRKMLMSVRRLTPLFGLTLQLVLCVNLLVPQASATTDSESQLEPAQEQAAPHSVLLKLSPELESFAFSAASNEGERLRVIVQTRNGLATFDEGLAKRGGRIRTPLPLIGGYVAELPASAIKEVAEDSNTTYISLDRKTSLMHSSRYDYNLLRVTTGAESVLGKDGVAGGDRVMADHVKSLPAGPNGTGVTIAVLDSGIYDNGTLHEDLRSVRDVKQSRVLLHRDFVTGEEPSGEQTSRGYDPYGHGTHVAGIAAGSGRESLESQGRAGNFYGGIAFNANLIDLRVIGTDGTGYMSDTIAAVEWMIANRKRYNIRVANFSIGAAVTQSYRTDPFCQAVERAVRAGITCVVAAGNFGKDEQGRAVYGSILAPGNHPMVITVGATNTWGTAFRSDDTIASYSSLGPSLVDFVAKPDIVAPGTLLRSIAADGNYLAAAHGLTVHEEAGRDVYMWLSGTSMAAPVVAGAAALMIDANPGMTPAMIKSILQFTAQPLPSLSGQDPLISMLTEGAGSVNIDGAVRMAKAFVKDPANAPLGSLMLVKDGPALDRLLYNTRDAQTHAFTSAIAGESISWGDNIFFSHGLVYKYALCEGRRLEVIKSAGWQVTEDFLLFYGYLSTNSRVLIDSRVLAESRVLTDSRVLIDSRVLTESRTLTDGWLFDGDSNGLTNPSAAQPAWSANLLDQGMLPQDEITGDSRTLSDAAMEQILAWGDDAAGLQLSKIESKKHPLYPRGKKIKNRKG
jgi:subtilisin family serine protease